ERDVFKLQKRIYRASARGDTKAVRRLQKLLLDNRAAKLLAVRRVTQDNSGKNAAGVDGVKSLPPRARLALAASLRLSGEADPVRRVHIPKPGSEELRPLGIPTIHDRALQTLVRFALEPEWEARFEPNSYGFRPGRSCWDAIQAIYIAVGRKDKYVLDADIAKCFDRIDHEALLRKVNTFPALARQLRAWLKAGVLDGDSLFPTGEGTLQGGAISPLLANIALHGLEALLKERFPRRSVPGTRSSTPPPDVVRYADDFVVLHKDREVVEQCQQVVAEWLRGMGLELKPSKTRIGHTRREVGGRAGFDFLGFTVRQFPAGASRSGCNTNGTKLGFKTSIRPSKESMKRHYARLREVIERYQDAHQVTLIGSLNPLIRGWSNYFSIGNSKRSFSKIGTVLFRRLLRWCYRRHPGKGKKWVVERYWRIVPGQGWRFENRTFRLRLERHESTQIVRHTKVQGARSPFDGDWLYWSSRLGHYPGVMPWVALLLKRQRGTCPRCGLYFEHGDATEVDHVQPRSEGGGGKMSNLQLLHRHCHHGKTSQDKRGVHDKYQGTEEPDAGKLARPVLEPSLGSDTPA
ncbi:MAG TPA: group II intron reverse transcriptase/maturase, partial [Gemmataceae bacterium]|nr:group II intron reverse transcriptase/maturase [Gemmataceae bacterium]